MQSIRTLFHSGARKFYADAEEWGITRRGALIIALFPLIVVGFVTLIAGLSFVMHGPFRAIFRWVTAEDSLLEWGQFLFVFVATLLFARMGVQLLRAGQRGIGLLYILLGLAAFFVAGEEISWGQRIFGWGTPETLDAINHQGETNVHNIRWVQRLFGYAVLFGSMYCTFVPLLATKFLGDRPRSQLSFLTIPAICMVPAFLMPFGYKMFRLLVWPGTDFTVVKFGEAPELCMYFGLLIFAYLNMRRLREVDRSVVTNTMPVSYNAKQSS
jgi:hypothetical protein